MLVNNNQPNFKAGNLTYAAEYAMSRRMSSGKFSALKDDFIKKYKDSEFDVELYTVGMESTRLCAKISKDGKFKRYIEETIFSSIFKGPSKFIEKIGSVIEKEIKPAIEKGW